MTLTIKSTSVSVIKEGNSRFTGNIVYTNNQEQTQKRLGSKRVNSNKRIIVRDYRALGVTDIYISERELHESRAVLREVLKERSIIRGSRWVYVRLCRAPPNRGERYRRGNWPKEAAFESVFCSAIVRYESTAKEAACLIFPVFLSSITF